MWYCQPFLILSSSYSGYLDRVLSFPWASQRSEADHKRFLPHSLQFPIHIIPAVSVVFCTFPRQYLWIQQSFTYIVHGMCVGNFHIKFHTFIHVSNLLSLFWPIKVALIGHHALYVPPHKLFERFKKCLWNLCGTAYIVNQLYLRVRPYLYR
jgi:hypothetical protein